MVAAQVVVRVLELRTQGADKVDKAKGRQGVEQMERGDSEMTDREKVMKGLSLCKWSNAGLYEGFLPEYEVCNKCPYARDDFEVDECCAELMRDALELLKAQKPRVLTLEEVMALPNGEETNAPVVREQKVPVETWDRGTVCQWCGARFVQETSEDNWYYGVEDYGKTWRVWTALPTKEQRNEVKWDEN